MVRDFCLENPQFADQSALEPFYFCESLDVTLPLGLRASTLEEFRSGVSRLSHSGFYFHFISSRLRLQLTPMISLISLPSPGAANAGG